LPKGSRVIASAAHIADVVFALAVFATESVEILP
jgi:hypothetical protein